MSVKRVNSRTTSTLQKSLKISTSEKDVENAFRAALAESFPSKTCSPFKVDGLLEDELSDVRSLLEFKHGWNLKHKVGQSGVLIQALFYIKKFELAGKKLPTTVFVGDNSECFCLKSEALIKYLASQIDWSTAPSDAKNRHPAILQAMVDDQNILPFVFDVNRKMFDFGEVVDQIKMLSKGVVYSVKISKDNMVEIFNYWRTNVLTDSRYDHQQDLFDSKDDSAMRAITSRQSDIFFACLTNKDETYLHPNKKNILVCRGENIKVNSDQHKSFFAHFSQVLSPSEMDVLTGNKDRIIEEVSRRRTGAFFTPTLWVAEAHKMLDESLGADWKEEYVVWDCASGTNNLTRDARFNELYCSTLDWGDVDTVKDMGYNKGSQVFQYDFLNDDSVDELGSKVPAGLKKAFADGKKVLFFINPPYGTANEMGNKSGKHKAGIAKNLVNIAMSQNKMGSAAQQLYSQFLYKICELGKHYPVKHCVIAAFTKPSFMSCESYGSFRKFFLSSFGLTKGMMFQASNFSDVSGKWGVSFTIWDSTNRLTTDSYCLDIKTLDTQTFSIKKVANKLLYSPDGNNASDWFREPIKNLLLEDCPALTTSIKMKKEGGKLSRQAIGFMANLGNNVYHNPQGCYLGSGCMSAGHVGRGDIVENNFRRAIALFCARRSVQGNWINDKDEYLVPPAADKSSPLNAAYEAWVNDALVYSLFNTSSQQSSLRDILYKGKTWQIKNHFFFMSAKEMKDLADKANFQEMYADAKAYGEDSFVFKQLASITLSDDAEAVLEAAKMLVRTSMAMRKTWHHDHPEAHLQAWNGGWAQLKPMMKSCYKAQYDQFVTTYKAFEQRMQKGVYEYGFLR